MWEERTEVSLHEINNRSKISIECIYRMCCIIDRKTYVGCRSCVGVKTLEDGALSVTAIMSYAYCQFILCRDHNATLAYSRLLTQLRCHISM